MTPPYGFPLSEQFLIDFQALGFRDWVRMGRYTYRNAQPPVPDHSHADGYEICLLERGQQSYTVAGKRFHLVGGDILVIRPGEAHGTGGAPVERGALAWFQFRRAAHNQHFLGLEPVDARALFQALDSLPCRKFRGAERVKPLVDEIIAAHAAPRGLLCRAELCNLFQRVLLNVAQLGRQGEPERRGPSIRQALDYIEENLVETLSLDDLALRCGLSSSYFKSAFKQAVGVPPAEYIARRRIEHAKTRLKETAEPVTTIACSLGFCSSQLFATVFKRFTGRSPQAFRTDPVPDGRGLAGARVRLKCVYERARVDSGLQLASA